MKNLKKYLAVILVITICFLMQSCDKSQKIVGQWYATSKVGSDYPEQFVLREDGTGTADGYTLNWHISDDVLYLSVYLFGSLEYEYYFDKNLLYLDDYEYARTN